jgi:hypothetical protein
MRTFFGHSVAPYGAANEWSKDDAEEVQPGATWLQDGVLVSLSRTPRSSSASPSSENVAHPASTARNNHPPARISDLLAVRARESGRQADVTERGGFL